MMPKDSNDLFLSALRSDDVDGTKHALNHGRRVSERFHFGRTPLHVAAESGSTNCVRLLVERGASLEVHDDAGSSPLLPALGNGNVETAAVLIELGALLSYRFTPNDSSEAREQHRQDFEAASTMAKQTYPDLHQLLNDSPGEFDQEAFQRELQESFITVAVSPKDIHAIHHCNCLATLQLVGAQPGVSFDLHDGGGYWPLKSMCESKDSAAVAWLLRHGATPDFTSTGGTALHTAVTNDSLECARLLLEAGANPNQQDVDGCVPMGGVENDAMLDLLLAHGADPAIGDQCDFKPSHWVKNAKLKARLLALEKAIPTQART